MLDERQILTLFILLTITLAFVLIISIGMIYIISRTDKMAEHLNAIRDLHHLLDTIANHIAITITTLQAIEGQIKVTTERLDDLISKENRRRRHTLISQAMITFVGAIVSTVTFYR